MKRLILGVTSTWEDGSKYVVIGQNRSKRCLQRVSGGYNSILWFLSIKLKMFNSCSYSFLFFLLIKCTLTKTIGIPHENYIGLCVN